jgi:hypothetical protein
MRKTIAVIALLVFVLAPLVSSAATLGGVTLPDSVQVNEKTLVLNGVGLRTKFIVKVYVAGLYLEQKSSDANAILKSDAPKRLVMHFVRDVSKSQMTDAFQEGFEKNSPEAIKSMKADIDRLLGAITDIKEGQEMVFTYVPGTGTIMSINGQDKVTIADPAFAPVVFSLWLGPKPPNADLKKGLLGQ